MTRAHILIQALSGQGKTFWSSMGGKPYVLAPEQKCRAIIPLINPNAKVFPLDTKEDFDKAIIAVQSEKLVENGYTRIVLDSFSELTEFIPGWFGMGFPLQIQDYGTIGNKAMSLVLAMLRSPIPGIVICRSEAKEQGKVSRVVPGSLGKSAANLPAKLVLTGETRHDDQFGWVVDTTPDSYTQRAGLPWVPSIFSGPADEFLAMVEAGPAGVSVFTVPKNEKPIVPEKTTAERIEDARIANAFTDAMATLCQITLNADITSDKRNEMVLAWEAKGPEALPDLLRAIEQIKANAPKPETVHESFQASQKEALARKPEPSTHAADFVDEVSPAIISDAQWLHFKELCNDAGLNLNEMEIYCLDKGKLAPPLPNAHLSRPLRGLLAHAWAQIEPILADKTRRRSFLAAIKQHCSAPKTQTA